MKVIPFVLLIGLVPSTVIKSQTCQDIFPFLIGWNKPVEVETYYPYNLWDIIDGAADSYLYYGFKELMVGEYTQGESSIRVDIFQHKDIYNAYGIYSLERSPDMRFINVGAEGYKYDGILNLFIDDYYIKISSHSNGENVEQAMNDLAGLFTATINPDAKLPQILSCFPEEKLRPYSKLYSPESYLGLEFLHTVFTAEYNFKDDLAYVVFLSAPGSRAEVLNMLGKYKSFCKYEGEITEGQVVEFNDPYNGVIYLANTSHYLVGTVYLNDKETAEKYIKQTLENCVNLETSNAIK